MTMDVFSIFQTTSYILRRMICGAREMECSSLFLRKNLHQFIGRRDQENQH